MARPVLSAPVNSLDMPNDELLDFIRGGSSGSEVVARLELLFPEDGQLVDVFAEEVNVEVEADAETSDFAEEVTAETEEVIAL